MKFLSLQDTYEAWLTWENIFTMLCNSGRHDGLIVSVLVPRAQLSRFKPWLGTLCWVLGQDTKTLAVPLSTQEYKWVLANCWGKPNKLWGSDLRWTSFPFKGGRNTPTSSMLQKVDKLWQLWASWLQGFIQPQKHVPFVKKKVRGQICHGYRVRISRFIMLWTTQLNLKKGATINNYWKRTLTIQTTSEKTVNTGGTECSNQALNLWPLYTVQIRHISELQECYPLYKSLYLADKSTLSAGYWFIRRIAWISDSVILPSNKWTQKTHYSICDKLLKQNKEDHPWPNYKSA